MNLYYFDSDKIITFTLPNKIVGNFWMTDSKNKNIINISANNGKWYISGGSNSKILSNNVYVDNIELKNKQYVNIEREGSINLLFINNVVDNTFAQYNVKDGIELKVGKDTSCDFCFSNSLLDDVEVILSFNNGTWFMKKCGKNKIYINNNIVIEGNVKINNGDVLNIYGNKIVFMLNILFVNNTFNNLNVSTNVNVFNLVNDSSFTTEDIIDKDMYRDEDYFFKSPRLRRTIKTLDMRIDSPPTRENNQDVPILYTLGPMITMGASSIVTLTTTFSKIGSGETTFKAQFPTLIVSCAMLTTMLVWPFLTKMYNKKSKKIKEEERQNRYKIYLEGKKKELAVEYSQQLQILEENLLPINACYNIILNRNRTLWERKLEQSDFLNVRVGKGKLPFDVKISYQSEDFTMDDDNLKKELDAVVNQYGYLENVPISYSFSNNNITAISGLIPKSIYFVNNCLLQFMAYHSYDNLKIVVFTNKDNSKKWEYLKISPYCFSNDKSIRFFGSNSEEMQNISLYLEQIFNDRKMISDNSNVSFTNFNSYYLILIDDIDSARKINIIDDILDSKDNYGFSLMILENKLSKLPSQCNNFISIGDRTSGILKNNGDINEQIYFADEISNSYDMNLCSYTLANIPLYIENNEKKLPNNVTFLEMFGVGNVEQLNSLNRWKNNNTSKSLKTEVGINNNGDPFILDLHEKQHGPHGLIAGMTGSGKSEFIITYILSMAVNYSPEEVAFVLIDYKGGGLTGAFENKELGIKLPHVVGTITNLDKSEINRALSSVDSELRRRQQKFNEVREATGEGTIDIYKYQKMYRDGIVDEPMPHLIIVSDEFAELKAQQPDFMDDLISTARIGRSLGVHLILATQKPTGVVDAQIWSNSKFKVCLKVQDKQDSMEMIKCADAAELKNVGRFYLQVGYNEYFALGQSAWSGAPYFSNKEFKKHVDKNIYFIDNIGSVYKSIDNNNVKKYDKSLGEELSNVVKYVIDVSNTMNFKIRQLWMDRIPANIYINNLVKKYNYRKQNFIINPIIGEYDDPSNQRQGLLTLPITIGGNSVVYGMADSGRDDFLQSLVYSIMTTYDSREVNMYLLDFGAETLMNFKDAPHVGDVILNNDDEKLNNFVKFISSEMNIRKKKFVSYNGNYLDYLKMSNEILPNIVVLINVVEMFNDNFADLFDKLFNVIRDGSKYGINFVFTTTNQNSIKYKVVQSCKQLFCLQLTTENQYRDILGNTFGIVPSKCLGRGLVKLDKVCEFQTAFIAPNENKFNIIRDTISLLNSKGFVKAKNVPMMPDIIELSKFNDSYLGINSVPIGINKDNLRSSFYDFSRNVVNIISSNELSSTNRFIKNFLKLLEMNNNFNKIVVDAINYFEDYNYKIGYVNNNFNQIVDSLKKIDDGLQEILLKNNMNVRSLRDVTNSLCVIIGFDKFYNKLDDEHRKIFIQILEHNKEALKINFVLVDIPSSFKKYEYEAWYKNNFTTDEGLWIGFGVSQQYVLKLLIQPAKISSIDNDYGILIKNGMPIVVKLINEFK